VKTLRFEVGASVMLVGDDLQFVGMADGDRIRFVIADRALRRMNGSAVELTRQQKFKIYDRNRELIQDIARRLWERAPEKKTVKIGVGEM
jgi:hypothetical protein